METTEKAIEPKAVIRTPYLKGKRKWESVKQGHLSGGSFTHLGTYGTDDYEFVTCVTFTSDERINIVKTDSDTLYIVSKDDNGDWWTVAMITAHAYLPFS